MKLLFDENLSHVLPAAQTDCYRESQHVRDVGLKASLDVDIWAYASSNQLAIVTKDSNFRQLSFLHGHPAKVIWIGLDNCSTKAVEALSCASVLER